MKNVITKIALFLCFFAISFFVVGCSPKENSGDTQEVRTLTVSNWKGYGSDLEYAVKPFEEANNCVVVHQYFDSTEGMLNLLRQGGVGEIDVVLSNIAYVGTGVGENLLDPIRTEELENYASLRKDMAEEESVKDSNGNIMGVPWSWGTTGLGYNPNLISEEIDSWASLWDPAYRGKVAFFDDHTTAILTGAMYTGAADPYEPDLEAVKAVLLDLKENSKVFWTSYDSFAKPYSAGEVLLGNLWSGAASQLNGTGETVTYVYPKEGTVAWVDYWCVVKDSPSEDLAYKWIDWMTSVEFQGKFSSDIEQQAPIPSNEDAVASLSPQARQALYLSDTIPETLVFQKGISVEKNQEWLDIWNEVKAD